MESLCQNVTNDQMTFEIELNKYETLLQWIENIDSNYAEFDTVSLRQDENDRKDEKAEKISTNRLGGQYSTGRPLPMMVREKIVELAQLGMKPCQISKQLRVSHGCVSKLLAKWRKTGTVKPEKIGGSRPKKVLPTVANAITVYKSWRPGLQSWQIKECLIRDGICTASNVPSVSSINKTLRNRHRGKPDANCAVESCQEIKRQLQIKKEFVSTSDVDQLETPVPMPVEPPPPPYPGVLIAKTEPMPIVGRISTDECEENRLPVEQNDQQTPESFDNMNYFFPSSSSSISSSSSSSEYGSMSFSESYADFGDLLSFLDDVFTE